MEIVCSPSGVVDRRYLKQGMKDIAEAGFSDVMLNLSLYCNGRELEGRGRDLKTGQVCRVLRDKAPAALQDEVQPFGKSCEKYGMHSSIAYMPYLLRDTKLGDCADLLTRLARESIMACRQVGCRYLAVRPLFAGVDKEKLWDVNRDFYLNLADEAKSAGVMLLLENQCRNLNGHLVRGLCSSPDEAAEWVDSLNDACGDERFGICFHVGVASLCGMDLHGFVKTAGSRLKALILSDTDGRTEGEFLPFTMAAKGASRTDWSRLVSGLRESAFDGMLVLALEDTLKAFPMELRRDVLKLAKLVGLQFKKQMASDIEALLRKYPQRVIFGAGNLCRIYMNVFGEKYPPLFITDNNAKLWGTELCGLPVKPPEELRSVPEECAIVICNVFYYESIRGQLQEMGLRNPVEVFNDEYMFSVRNNLA